MTIIHGFHCYVWAADKELRPISCIYFVGATPWAFEHISLTTGTCIDTDTIYSIHSIQLMCQLWASL